MRFLSTRLRFVATLICLLTPASLIASGFPKPLHKFPVGPLPAGVAVGDFNRDGKLDLVLVNQDNFTITVVLGRGDGTFRSPITSPDTCVAAAAGPVFTGDFNGNHKLDIAFSGGNGFCVSLGNGDGTFASTVNYPDPGGEPIGVGDLNGDGKLDVVFRREINLTFVLDLFFGNGDGSFRIPTSSLPANSACALADVNGDGKLDLVGGTVQLGNGNGTFRAPIQVPATGYCPAVADFNGDGKLDLAIPAPNGVSLLFGNGNGTFQPPVTHNLGIPMNLGSGSLLTADFNGDAKADLFIKQNQFVGTILLNSGSGKFSSTGATSYQFSELTDYFLGDFNGDRRADVISVGGSQFFARIALAQPDGTLPMPRAYLLKGDNALSVTAGDFNGDGRLDLAAVTTNLQSYNTGELNVLLGKGSGTFGRPPIASITGDIGTRFVATADLNHDGTLDLVMASSGSVDVRLGLGNGTFQKSVKYPMQGPTSIAIADFNGDGIPDLAVNSANHVPGQILLGNGDGTFRSGPSLPGGIQSLAAADFNHDGKIDLAVGFSGAVGIMLGNGDGRFQPVSVLRTGQSGSLIAADFNNDGELDVAGVGTGTSGTVVSVYLGNGKGAITWAHNSLIAKDSGVFMTAATADFDGDGVADIAVTIGDGIAVAHGKGTGYFQPYFYPTAAGGLVVGDLDGDGTPDLAVTTEGQNSVVVLLNKP
jgi:hypothetical protein